MGSVEVSKMLNRSFSRCRSGILSHGMR
uniref:Uncharacterized protein n=1 Tax=Arundo donax TaxID=35708 RepID=A0A0A9BSZ6_ARUDO